MSWDYKLTASAIKQMRRLGPEGRKRIFAYLDNNIVGCNDSRQFGKGLTGDLGEFWRYRTSHYRMVCRIEDDELVVLVVKAGHRRDIYD